MWIPRAASLGSLVLALGCTPDGGVIVLSTGGGGDGGTAPTTSTGGAGGAGGTTTPTTGGGEGGGTPTTTDGGGTGGGTTTTDTGGAGGGTTTTMPVQDEDQDGWSVADGDCCDSIAAFCASKPELVNPGALEYPGNQVDDDCNPATLDNEPYPTCSSAAQATTDLQNGTPIGAIKLVRAMDLCQLTAEDPPLPQKTWGVLSAQYSLADASAAAEPDNVQFGVLPDFGPNVLPFYGETLAAIASGTARREGDPGFVHPKSGAPGQAGSYDAQTTCPAPPSYVAAHGGTLPSQCTDCTGPSCTTAHDSAALRVRVRPPTNARGFSYRLLFFSSEYPQYVCQEYNDFFLALIGGNVSPQIPADGNVAFDAAGQPISVNNALFDVCVPTPGHPCMGGTLQLVGNGWGGWNGSVSDGGATGWLVNEVPLALKLNPADPDGDPIPTAEPFELQLVIWDAGDHNVDSLVLLDRFRWSVDPVTLGTHHE